MEKLDKLASDVINGKEITINEARSLYDAPLEELCFAADKIRRECMGSSFDICTIINGKSGKCSENCRFCAQSGHNHTGVACYPLLSSEEIVKEAVANYKSGMMRFSIVTSGKRLSDEEVNLMCDTVRAIHEACPIKVCVSFGLLNEDQFRRLKEAGVCRVHNNLETSGSYFPKVCTTHTYEDKKEAIRAARSAGLEVCSGGLIGMGETRDDRLEMAFTLRELGIRSVPVNLLNPIPGTPFGDQPVMEYEEFVRTIAIYRFILPSAYIRLAGGRGLMPDKGKTCFKSGANAAISGDMLTTSGITAATDLKLLDSLGYKISQ